MNLYAYAHNNSMKYVDPSGHSVKKGSLCSFEQQEFGRLLSKNNNYEVFDANEQNVFNKLVDNYGNRYIDSMGNRYDLVSDYLYGNKKTIVGDPLMYSQQNKNGGNIVLSTEPITGKSYINTLDYYVNSAEKVIILSGSHGTPTGE